MQCLCRLLATVLSCSLLTVCVQCGGNFGASTGAALVRDSGLPGGIGVVVGAADAGLALSMAEQKTWVVHALCGDEAGTQRAREAMRSAGVYGRVSADRSTLDRLPYTENLINLLVVATGTGPAPEEIHRVLAPLGVAYFKSQPGNGRRDVPARLPDQLAAAGFEGIREIPAAGGWWRAMKRWPEEIDEWSHHLHSADGNPVANDRIVGPPRHYQWVGGPRWQQSHETDSSLRCLVTARGRIYYIVNEAPTSLAGPESPPDNWFLAARDAFNGVPLWKIPIRQWGWREWKPTWFTPRPGVIPINLDKRVVAAGENLFATLGYRAPVSEIDGRTGEVLQTFAGTARTAEILHHDGRLLLTVLENDRAWVKSVDVASGRLLWTSEKNYGGTVTDYYRFFTGRGQIPEAKVDPTLDIASDGDVVALLDGDSLAALDYDTGKEKWRSAFPLVEEDHTAGRISAHQKVWSGTMIVSEGVVLHASPNQLAAFSSETGEILWKQPKKYLQHLWYEWKDVFVIDGLVWTWSAEIASIKPEGGGNWTWPVSLNGYSLRTGRLEREVPLGNIFNTHHHHRCYRNKATVLYVLASRRGTEYVDLTNGNHSINNWVRGTCHMGMMPANGLQYAPPHPCECYIDEKLNALNALAGARIETPGAKPSLARLEQGPAFQTALSGSSLPDPDSAEDWPTFRADSARSGSSGTHLPSALKPVWRIRLGERVGPVIVVDGVVYVPLVDEHQIVAVDASNGRGLWRFTAGARIDSPPTYDRGAILFGSADGCVYRVAARSGELIWRFRPVPEDRRMAAFGQLESAWPVSGSVLVASDPGDPAAVNAYFVAGRSSHLDGGLRLCAIDAETGVVRHEKTLQGPSYAVDEIKNNFKLPMGALPDILRREGSAIFLRENKFNGRLEEQKGGPLLRLRGGFLDDAYFKRMPWSMGGSGHARLIVYDDDQAYCLRMFDTLEGLNPEVYFTPGKKGYLLFAYNLESKENTWEQRIPIRVRAMAVTADQLCLAGPPDLVDADDPLGAFEGRKGAALRILDKATGRIAGEHRLPSPAVFNGAVAAEGRLFLSLEDGSLACFGK